jgi:hypothetical protein
VRKNLSLEQQLDRLSQLRANPEAPELRPELARAISGKSNLLAAKAARIAGEFKISSLVPELMDAFERFLVRPETTDKGCSAKTGIVKALCAMEHAAPALYRKGVHHVQMERSWGGSADTAGPLRAASAIALAQTESEILPELVDLMVDRDPTARAAAVRAIAGTGRPAGPLLLRLKARVGDERPEVLGECFAALLQLEPRESLDFVAGYLDAADPDVCEAAALALGESKAEAALGVLKAHFQRSPSPELRKVILLAIALMRREEALDFLVSLVAEGGQPTAAAAIAALATYRQDERIRRRVEKAVAGRPGLSEVFHGEFGG